MRQSYMHIRRRVIVAALAGALSAPALVAQPRVDVTTRLGGIKFDRAASLETSAFLGLDATYRLNPYFSLGTALNVTQANTTAEDFITSLSFGIPLAGDTTTFYGVGQAVNLIQASIIGVIRPMSGRLVPFALAGAGYYGAFLDPQIKHPKLKIAGKLALKHLRMRTLFDVIPLDATLVKGSHGRVPEDSEDWPVLIGDLPNLPRSATMGAQEVCDHLIEHCSRGSGYAGVGR